MGTEFFLRRGIDKVITLHPPLCYELIRITFMFSYELKLNSNPIVRPFPIPGPKKPQPIDKNANDFFAIFFVLPQQSSTETRTHSPTYTKDQKHDEEEYIKLIWQLGSSKASRYLENVSQSSEPCDHRVLAGPPHQQSSNRFALGSERLQNDWFYLCRCILPRSRWAA